jgi:hypothetical protein
MTYREQLEMTMDIGTGASRISWKHDSARNLLARIMQEYPDGDYKTWAQHLRERAPEEDCDWPIYLYFTHNHANALNRERRKRRYIKQKGVKRAKARLRTALLDLVLPNGKRLAECTGAECKRFGQQDRKRGVWLERVGDEVGPTKLVGDVLDERHLKSLMRTTVVPAQG